MKPVHKALAGAALLVTAGAAVFVSQSGPKPTAPAPMAITAPAAQGGYRLLPDPKLTPGVTDPALTASVLCARGFTTKTIRNVPDSEKQAVYAEYGIASRKPGEYEVDHLVSLELGGKNDIGNLWPESYISKPWNAHVKDALENFLHRHVCSGEIPLAQAQQEISTDWIAAYKKYGAKYPAELPAVAQ